MVVSTGIISTIAGTGSYGFSGDGGQALSAELDGPYGVGLDSSGILLLQSIIFFNVILFPQVTCTSLIIIIIVSAR